MMEEQMANQPAEDDVVGASLTGPIDSTANDSVVAPDTNATKGRPKTKKMAMKGKRANAKIIQRSAATLNATKIARAAPARAPAPGTRPTLMHWEEHGEYANRPAAYADPTIIMQPVYAESRYHAEYAAFMPHAFASEVIPFTNNDGLLRSQLLQELGVLDAASWDLAHRSLIEYGMKIEEAVSLLCTFYTAQAISQFYDLRGKQTQAVSRLNTIASTEALTQARMLSNLLEECIYYPKLVDHARAAHAAFHVPNSRYSIGARATTWFRPHPMLIQINNKFPTFNTRPELAWANIFEVIRTDLLVTSSTLLPVLQRMNTQGMLPDAIGLLPRVTGSDVNVISNFLANNEITHGHINMPAYVPYVHTSGAGGNTYRATPRFVPGCSNKLFYYTPMGMEPGVNWPLTGYTYVDGHYTSYGPLCVAAMPNSVTPTPSQPFASLWRFDETGKAVELGELEDNDNVDHAWAQERGGKSTFLKLGAITTDPADAAQVVAVPGNRLTEIISTGGIAAHLDVHEFIINREQHRQLLVNSMQQWYGALPSYSNRSLLSLKRHAPVGDYLKPNVDTLDALMTLHGFTGFARDVGYPGIIDDWNYTIKA